MSCELLLIWKSLFMGMSVITVHVLHPWLLNDVDKYSIRVRTYWWTNLKKHLKICIL